MKSKFIKLILGFLFCILGFYLYLRLTYYEQTPAFFGLALLFIVKSLIADRADNKLEELKDPWVTSIKLQTNF